MDEFVGKTVKVVYRDDLNDSPYIIYGVFLKHDEFCIYINDRVTGPTAISKKELIKVHEANPNGGKARLDGGGE
jgi:hypothetical protein